MSQLTINSGDKRGDWFDTNSTGLRLRRLEIIEGAVDDVLTHMVSMSQSFIRRSGPELQRWVEGGYLF